MQNRNIGGFSMDKLRIVTDLDIELVKELDYICKTLCISRSSYLRMLIIQDLTGRKIFSESLQ